MKALVLASGLLAVLAGAAHAGCKDALRELDSSLGATEIAPETKSQLQDMRKQADALCAAGNDEEASDVIAEALSMLSGQAQ